MISDLEVQQYFRKQLEVPGAFGGPGSLQILRGKPLHLVDNMPLGECVRHKMVFDKFGVIPEYCFDCYKVQVAPRSVVELFKLLMILEELVLPDNNRRKCMVEKRADCTDAYKGLIYSRSLEKGEVVRDVLQQLVAANISPDVPVMLKRGCSEFSQAIPEYGLIQSGSVSMKFPKDWKVHEDFVDSNTVWPLKQESENAYVKSSANNAYPPSEIFAMHYWLRYAATIGDLSYLEISGKTVPLLPQLKRPPFSFTGR